MINEFPFNKSYTIKFKTKLEQNGNKEKASKLNQTLEVFRKRKTHKTPEKPLP